MNLPRSHQRNCISEHDMVQREQTIAEIEEINGNAMRRVGLLVEDFSDERLQREEDNLFVGFRIEPDADHAAIVESRPVFGEELTTATSSLHADVNGSCTKSADLVSDCEASDEFSGCAERHSSPGDSAHDTDFEFEDI